ncbi:hypothetical protein MTR67_051963 [Solanum verrucosum]|uniref:Uncharacterized protein n=1 Tax=Solanum verrucosum TaxID=315347 RepID=A0AAF1A2J4_SOLVR|nr:hypothetical protein MTR67_051963 [Solanum verrucosum]
MKRTKKLKPELCQAQLASRQRDRSHPLFYTIPPNGPEREVAEGKHETPMRQKKGESSSHSMNSTNFAELSASTKL